MAYFDDILPKDGAAAPAQPKKKTPGYFDDILPPAPAPESAAPPAAVEQKPPTRTVAGTVGDIGVAALKSAVAVPESVVGLADLATGGYAGKAVESAGVKFKETQEILDTMYSPAQQAAKKRVSEGFDRGVIEGAKAAVTNPSVVASTTLESAGSMLLGGGYGRIISGLAKWGSKAMPAIAAAGEGLVGAGSAAESTRQQTADGLLTAKQLGLSAASGAGTAAFGYLGGKVAQKLGIADVDVLAAGGDVFEAAAKKGIARRVVEGAFSEGLLEELPQSVQEQVLSNLSLDKDPWEGVGESAVMGALAGAVMGGAAAVKAPKTAPTPPADPTDARIRNQEEAVAETTGAPLEDSPVLDTTLLNDMLNQARQGVHPAAQPIDLTDELPRVDEQRDTARQAELAMLQDETDTPLELTDEQQALPAPTAIQQGYDGGKQNLPLTEDEKQTGQQPGSNLTRQGVADAIAYFERRIANIESIPAKSRTKKQNENLATYKSQVASLQERLTTDDLSKVPAAGPAERQEVPPLRVQAPEVKETDNGLQGQRQEEVAPPPVAPTGPTAAAPAVPAPAVTPPSQQTAPPTPLAAPADTAQASAPSGATSDPQATSAESLVKGKKKPHTLFKVTDEGAKMGHIVFAKDERGRLKMVMPDGTIKPASDWFVNRVAQAEKAGLTEAYGPGLSKAQQKSQRAKSKQSSRVETIDKSAMLEMTTEDLLETDWEINENDRDAADAVNRAQSDFHFTPLARSTPGAGISEQGGVQTGVRGGETGAPGAVRDGAPVGGKGLSDLGAATDRGRQGGGVTRGGSSSDLDEGPEVRFARFLGKLFGKRVVFGTFQFGNTDGVLRVDGAMLRSVGDIILIDVRTDVKFNSVFGHELLHHLKNDSPSIYRALLDAIRPTLDVKGFRKMFPNGRAGESDADVIEEMLANLLGKNFDDATFWAQVEANMGESKFTALAQKITNWIDSLLAKMTGGETYDYMAAVASDLKRTRAILAKGTAEYLKQQLAKQVNTGAAYGLMTTSGGDTVLNAAEAAAGVAKYSITTPGKGGRFYRGAEAKQGKPAHEVVAENLDDSVIADFDNVLSVEEAVETAANITPLEPTVITTEKALRYDKSPEGYYGNEKMKFPNDAYPNGRNTWDIPGCGRLAWAQNNEVDRRSACYGGACYAEALKIGKQGKQAGVTAGLNKIPAAPAERQQVLDHLKANGLEATQKAFPQFEVIVYDKISATDRRKVEEKGLENFPNFFMEDGKLKKGSVGKFKAATGEVVSFDTLAQFKPLAAVVSTNLQPANGQDIRLGVDTDGAAWLSNPDVMDALLAANPRSLSVYSSAYHTPPPAHPLSGRTIINVTVSGWHPLPETLHRLKWAEEARANGWNVILREVVADPAVFGEDAAKVYNRLHDALLKTDFFIMQQALHDGQKVGDKELFGLPGCCKGSAKNPGTCDACEVSEGLGKKFLEYWNVADYSAKEDRLFPDVAGNASDAFIAEQQKEESIKYSGRNLPLDQAVARDRILTAITNQETQDGIEPAESGRPAQGVQGETAQDVREPEYQTHQFFDHYELGEYAREVAAIASELTEAGLPWGDAVSMLQVEMRHRAKTAPDLIPLHQALFKQVGLKQLAAEYKPWVDANAGTAGGERYSLRAGEDLAAIPPLVKPKRTVLGNAINTDFLKKGAASLVGRKVKSADELAEMVQIFRNPSYETFRIFLVKGSTIVGQTGVSMRLPGVTNTFPGPIGEGTLETGLAWLRDQMTASGANGYYLMHNHPSGRVKPSPADVNSTYAMMKAIPGFKGHVIVNHNKYTVLDGELTREEKRFLKLNQKAEFEFLTDAEAQEMRLFPSRVRESALMKSTGSLVGREDQPALFFKDIPLTHQPKVAHPLLGREISSPEALATVGAELQLKDKYVVLVGVSATNNVRGLLEVPLEDAINPKRNRAIARRFARQTGSNALLAILPPKSPEMPVKTSQALFDTFNQAVESGILLDVVTAEGNSYRNHITPRRDGTTAFGVPMVGRDVGARYSTRTSVPVVSATPFDGDNLWRQANEYYRDKIQGTSVTNLDLGEIAFNKEARSKILSINRNDPRRTGIVKVLPDLAKIAIPYNDDMDQKFRGGVEAFVYAVAPVEIGGETYAVKLVLKRTKGGVKAYHLTGYDIDPGAITRGFDDTAVRPQGSPESMSTVSVDQLVDAVNGTARFSLRVPPNLAANWKPTFDYLRMKLQDKFVPLKNMEKLLRSRGWAVRDADLASRAEELFHGKVGKRLEDFFEGPVKQLFESIKSATVTQAELEDYLYALHAPARNAYIASINPKFPDGGSGMTNAEARRILADFRNQGKTQELEQLAQQVRDITKTQRDIIRSEGLEEDDTIDAWEQLFDVNYVPLKGGKENQGKGVGTGFNIKRSGTKRTLGRSSKAENILAHLFEQVGATIIRAEKAKVGRAFLSMAEANPDPDLWTVHETLPSRQALAPNPEVKRLKREIAALDQMIASPQYTADRQALTQLKTRKALELAGQPEKTVQNVPDQSFAQQDDVLTVTLGDGTIKYVEIEDADLARVMKNVGGNSAGKFVRAMAGIVRTLAATRTSFSPEFLLTNFLRDVQMAGINLTGEQSGRLAKDVITSLPKAMMGIREVLRGGTRTSDWAQWYERFREAGAGTSFLELRDMENWQRRLNNISKSGVMHKAAHNAEEMLKIISDYNTVVESAVRLATFRKAVESGMSESDAASLAKNLTVNFNRKGEWGPALNAAYMFANAGIQGSARVLQAVGTSRKVQALMGATVAASFLLAEMARAVGGEDDDGEDRWDKLSDFTKQGNWIFLTPDGDKVTIRLPYGYNWFVSLGYALNDMAHGSKTPWEGAKFLTSGLMNAFNPFGGDDGLLQQLSPTLTDPIVELATNENFMGEKIMPENMPFGPQKPDSQLYFRSASKPSRWVAETLNDLTGGDTWEPGAVDISPETIDHMVDFIGGGVLSTVRRLTDLPFKAAEGDLKTNDLPFVRQVYQKPTPYADFDRFYQNINRITANKANLKQREGADREAFRKEHPEIQLAVAAESYRDRMSAIRKRYHKARDGGRMAEARAYEKEMQALALKFNKRYNEVVGK